MCCIEIVIKMLFCNSPEYLTVKTQWELTAALHFRLLMVQAARLLSRLFRTHLLICINRSGFSKGQNPEAKAKAIRCACCLFQYEVPGEYLFTSVLRSSLLEAPLAHSSSCVPFSSLLWQELSIARFASFLLLVSLLQRWRAGRKMSFKYFKDYYISYIV